MLRENLNKLNRKGYLTIEIILASVIAFAIAFFLIEITMKLVNITDDYYLDTVLVTDKSLITKNIRENIQEDINLHGTISDITCDSDSKCRIKYSGRCVYKDFYGYTNYEAPDGEIDRYMEITPDNKIEYYSINEDNSKNIIYSKELNKNLTDVKIKLSNVSDNGDFLGRLNFDFVISATNIFSSNNYFMTIPIYNECTSMSDDKKIVILNWFDGENGQQSDSGYITQEYKNISVWGFHDSVYDDTQDITCTNGMTVSSAIQYGGALDISFVDALSDTECNIPTRKPNTYLINITVHYGADIEEKLVLEAREYGYDSIAIRKKSEYPKYEKYECTNTSEKTYFDFRNWNPGYFTVSYPEENFDCDIYFTS